MDKKKSILIFGTGPLQKSLIERCKSKGLFTIGIDPDENAICRDLVDVFELVGANDFKGTLNVANKYHISGLVTAATDKPLVMMAHVAEKLQLRFFSIDTAVCSTDKFLMKQKFQKAAIPCAKGFILNSIEELSNLKIDYPVIVKPRDNSGSRGVIYCEDSKKVEIAVKEALQFTKKGNVLIEQFIGGKEYSIESVHYAGKTYVIQYTEKITTSLPYNVELGHIQPADLSAQQKEEIKTIISSIAECMGFINCASHTELKIDSENIYVIETSPRLGGDFITSTLLPLSTGINMEDILVDIAINQSLQIDSFDAKINKTSGVKYFELAPGFIRTIHSLDTLNNIPGLQQWYCNVKQGEKIDKITSSLDRVGYAIFRTETKDELLNGFEQVDEIVKQKILISTENQQSLD